MNQSDQQTAIILTGLLEVCRDSAELLKRDACSLHSPKLADALLSAHTRRVAIGREIQEELNRSYAGCPTPTMTSVEDSAGLTEGVVVEPSDHDLLKDCLQWERQTLAAFEDAACELSGRLHERVDRQAEEIRQWIERAAKFVST